MNSTALRRMNRPNATECPAPWRRPPASRSKT
jgi:hypothetical protein